MRRLTGLDSLTPTLNGLAENLSSRFERAVANFVAQGIPTDCAAYIAGINRDLGQYDKWSANDDDQ